MAIVGKKINNIFGQAIVLLMIKQALGVGQFRV